MSILRPVPPSHEDPCLQIQADLSAMLDGELEASLVRRVLVHSDACPSCRSFLEGIRMQARAHHELHSVENGEPGEFVQIGSDDPMRVEVETLRRQLMENRRILARILYELGRGFVFMGVSPRFSRVVQREPVPLPDMFQRARNLLDEVERIAVVLPGSSTGVVRGSEWVRARELFESGEIRTPAENLARGQELLREALILDEEQHDARIHLGHALHLSENNDAARVEFEKVLSFEIDLETRSYALLNLGNVHLDDGRFEQAIECFTELVDSGIVERSSNFGLTHFNLAIAYGLIEDFEQCEVWLSRLYREMPHKRRMIAEQLRAHEYFAETLARHPRAQRFLAERLPGWFPIADVI
ncbi:MAG: tetratricopeptide repeat protein [Planctomycetes bacterium]|nr:tetratricopeptide repeat protein [Planctomycetota bacterium]